MKLIIAIISNKDTEKILDILSKSGFPATKVSSTGQFLEGGHSSLFIGVEDKKVEEVHKILQDNVTKRIVKQHGIQSTMSGTLLKQPVDVEEYGGISFIIDVEEFRKF